MTFFAILFWAAYLGTPLFIVLCWISLPKATRPRWPLWGSLGAWLLQLVVWVAVIVPCLGGHCRLSPIVEHGPIVLTVLAYVAIVWMLWYAWTTSSRALPGRTPHPPG